LHKNFRGIRLRGARGLDQVFFKVPSKFFIECWLRIKGYYKSNPHAPLCGERDGVSCEPEVPKVFYYCRGLSLKGGLGAKRFLELFKNFRGGRV